MTFQSGSKWRGNKHGAPHKETRLSTWIEKELEREYDTSTMEGYEAKVQAAKIIARRIVESTVQAKDLATLLDGADFIANRTEGKPKQAIDHTTDGKPLPTPIYGGLSVQQHDSDQEDL